MPSHKSDDYNITAFKFHLENQCKFCKNNIIKILFLSIELD